MQKKIIALAIASALTAPALAFADATVYGQANLSVDIVNDGMTNSARTNQLNSNASRLGLKGSEDLGNGLSAVWQMEGAIGMDTGTVGTTLFSRDTYLGLSSATAGTGLVGRHATPYYMATRKLDMFADGIADNRGSQVDGKVATTPFNDTLMGGGHDVRLGNVIAYISPSMSGFSVAAASAFGAETAAANTTKGSLYSLAGMYEQGPIYATVAYDTIKAGSGGSGDLGAGLTGGIFAAGAVDDKKTAFKVGGSFTTDAFAVNAVLERITATTAATGVDLKNTNFYLAGKFNLTSTDDVKLAYTRRGDTTGNTNNAKQYTVGYDHSLSKATSVYALYTKLTDNTVNVPDPSAVSLGVKHSF
jgi:predicted porin